MRYTDEGPISELCKWSVDLAKLPLFQKHSRQHRGGFFTEFELGLELDSAGETNYSRCRLHSLRVVFSEVRGVLLQDGKEVSRVVFDFFQVCLYHPLETYVLGLTSLSCSDSFDDYAFSDYETTDMRFYYLYPLDVLHS